MPGSSVNMSVRLAQEDADFIAAVDVAGAKTPSEKLRAIIRQARTRYEGTDTFTGCLDFARDLLAPARHRIAAAEHDHQVHSELVAVVAEALPAMVATLMTGPDVDADGTTEAGELANVEQALADRVFALAEALLRLGVTRQCRCYDKDVIRRRIDPILELAQVILATRAATKEKQI